MNEKPQIIHWQQEAQKYLVHIFPSKCECTENCDAPRYTAWFPDFRATCEMDSSTPHGAMQKAYETLAEVLADMAENGQDIPAPSKDEMYELMENTMYEHGKKYEFQVIWRN